MTSKLTYLLWHILFEHNIACAVTQIFLELSESFEYNSMDVGMHHEG